MIKQIRVGSDRFDQLCTSPEEVARYTLEALQGVRNALSEMRIVAGDEAEWGPVYGEGMAFVLKGLQLMESELKKV